jgi:endoglucanase
MSFARLSRILSQPSTPFREEAVAKAAAALLSDSGTPHFFDAHGNLVVGAGSLGEYLSRLERHSGPPIPLFIAHMDHPGFHGESWTKRGDLVTEWLGGGPTKFLVGHQVWLARAGEAAGTGTIVKARTKGRRLLSLTVRPVDRALAGQPADALYGGFSFKAPLWKAGDRLYTKAADDLVGAHCILELAARLADRRPLPFLGVLTRAEEIGFIGMIHHFEAVLKGEHADRLFCVSLETSRAYPGAEWGKGPVVRLGDRATVFDPAGVEWMTRVARQALGKRFQRRVMDGGVCEATVANALGYRTVGISVPLGNYHNECFTKNFPKEKLGGPAPEFVSLKDVEGLIRLGQALVENPFPGEAAAWRLQRESFARYRAEFAKKMARSFGV